MTILPRNLLLGWLCYILWILFKSLSSREFSRSMCNAWYMQ